MSNFPLRNIDETYEQWCDRLVAHIRLLEMENQDLRDTLTDLEKFKSAINADVNRLERWLA